MCHRYVHPMDRGCCGPKEQLCQSRKVESWWQRPMARWSLGIVEVSWNGIMGVPARHHPFQEDFVNHPFLGILGSSILGKPPDGVNVWQIHFLFLKTWPLWAPETARGISDDFGRTQNSGIVYGCLIIEFALVICRHHEALQELLLQL